MKIEIKKVIWPSLMSSIFLLLLGVLLFFKSSATLMGISYLVGGVLIALGIIAIINFLRNSMKDIFNQLNIVYGTVSIVAGIFLVTVPEFIGSIIPIVVGITVIISSSFKVQQALMLKNIGSSYFLPSLIMAIICLLCGLIILFNPFTSAVVVLKIIGLFMIIYALLDIVNSILLKRSSNISVEISTNTKKNKHKKAKTAKIVKEVEKGEE